MQKSVYWFVLFILKQEKEDCQLLDLLNPLAADNLQVFEFFVGFKGFRVKIFYDIATKTP